LQIAGGLAGYLLLLLSLLLNVRQRRCLLFVPDRAMCARVVTFMEEHIEPANVSAHEPFSIAAAPDSTTVYPIVFWSCHFRDGGGHELCDDRRNQMTSASRALRKWSVSASQDEVYQMIKKKKLKKIIERAERKAVKKIAKKGKDAKTKVDRSDVSLI
jgi:hypothetical protein